MATDFNINTRETTRQFNRSHGSFELAFAPVLLALLGLWIDHRLGTTPIFVVSLAIFGSVGAGMKIFFAYRYEMAQHAERLSALRSGGSSRGTTT